MRDVASPVLKTLRQSPGRPPAGVREEQGVEARDYRTIVLGATTRGRLDLPNGTALNPQQLSELRRGCRCPGRGRDARGAAAGPRRAQGSTRNWWN
ncbi:MAG: hypothetical protein IPP44_12385 [Ideonella sp.]|nr:hypothetical protein [Ideonella sp.]